MSENLLRAPIDLPATRGQQLADLRLVLAEKFPCAPARAGGILATGVETIDRMEGGLRRGALTEICGSPAAGSLILAMLLSMLARENRVGALVDCGRFFDPGSFQPKALKHLLWVRCGLPAEAVKAADLLLRDGNLSLLMLDLQGAELRSGIGIPASTWHRFQRVVEQGEMALAVFTPRPLVEGASVRITASWHWNFEAMAGRRSELLAGVSAHVAVRRSLRTPDFAELRTA